MPTLRHFDVIASLSVLCAISVSAPAVMEAQEFELSIESIMRGPELVGRSPQALRGGGFGGQPFSWAPDSRHIYFRWQQPGVDTALAPYRVGVDGGAPQRITDRAADTVLAGSAAWTPDGRRAVYSNGGDLTLWDDGTMRRLTETFESETNPQWSDDGTSVFFRRGNNLYALHLERGRLWQLTDIRTGRKPPEEKNATGQRGFLEEQERALIEYVDTDRYREQPWFRETPEDTLRPKPFYLGANNSVGGMWAAPDGRYVLLTVTSRPTEARRVDMAVWITDDGYVDVQQVRTKVGDEQSSARAAILNVATGETTYVGDSVGIGDRSIRGVAVSPNSRYALLRVETYDDERRWYVVVDLETLDTRVVDELHDPAWLAGPSYFTAGFMPDGETVYFVSETTGWAHLYLVPAAGGEATALTTGEWEVLSARLSVDGSTWYITGNRDGFAEVHFYTLPARGGRLVRVTDQQGRQDAVPSPDGRWLAVRHSEANRPPELYLQANEPSSEMRQITMSTTEEWRSFDWTKPDIVMIPARDGVEVPARIYRPTGNIQPEGQRPAVIFVHGAGYMQNVHNWWSNYYREYMFHHFLASQGYTVLDIDYRGSAGHGRDWRTAIFRHMGGKDLTDQVDGAGWLVANAGVDASKIGIYGGSYGGFITLMAMFTEPGVFEAGAALRPVTDWAHYNHGYTSNILNEPQTDSVAYQRSSPIYFAEGLEGHLLMAHGMVDDNVHFHDTVRLAQRLIELGKENWEVAIYPGERHGFTQPSSWTDEYRRIFKLFEGSLR